MTMNASESVVLAADAAKRKKSCRCYCREFSATSVATNLFEGISLRGHGTPSRRLKCYSVLLSEIGVARWLRTIAPRAP